MAVNLSFATLRNYLADHIPDFQFRTLLFSNSLQQFGIIQKLVKYTTSFPLICYDVFPPESLIQRFESMAAQTSGTSGERPVCRQIAFIFNRSGLSCRYLYAKAPQPLPQPSGLPASARRSSLCRRLQHL